MARPLAGTSGTACRCRVPKTATNHTFRVSVSNHSQESCAHSCGELQIWGSKCETVIGFNLDVGEPRQLCSHTAVQNPVCPEQFRTSSSILRPELSRIARTRARCGVPLGESLLVVPLCMHVVVCYRLGILPNHKGLEYMSLILLGDASKIPCLFYLPFG